MEVPSGDAMLVVVTNDGEVVLFSFGIAISRRMIIFGYSSM